MGAYAGGRAVPGNHTAQKRANITADEKLTHLGEAGGTATRQAATSCVRCIASSLPHTAS